MKHDFGKHSTKVQQLADILEKGITAGHYEEGNNLPSINQLSQANNVSRDTVFKAFALLREKGFIDSTPGRGYYVTKHRKKVLLLLDEYSPFKTTFYNSLIQHLSADYQVDLWFHQYNQRLFNVILGEAIGKYNYYVVMNFSNEKFSPIINKLPKAKVLLLDFGNFPKDDYAYICQDFNQGLYDALMLLRDRFKLYHRNFFLYPKGIKHPHISCDSFMHFCKENEQEGVVIDNVNNLHVEKGNSYFVIRQSDVVDIIKKSRALGLKCGKDFGLIVYNDTPAYEVIDEGITALTIDWVKMGKMTACYITEGTKIQAYLPTEIHLRNSL